MKLSSSMPVEIVKKINADIDQKINIMNEEGIIIASTDPVRVNTFHEGAKKIVDENLEELIVHYNGEFEGSMCGTNFPIVFHGKTIGVIGLTGNYEEMEALAEELKAHLEDKYPLRLAIGIDSGKHSYQQMHMAYVKANKALQACLRMHKKDIRFYDDINMEIFSDEVTDITKQEYISRIFKGYSNEEIEEALCP